VARQASPWREVACIVYSPPVELAFLEYQTSRRHRTTLNPLQKQPTGFELVIHPSKPPVPFGKFGRWPAGVLRYSEVAWKGNGLGEKLITLLFCDHIMGMRMTEIIAFSSLKASETHNRRSLGTVLGDRLPDVMIVPSQ
jgi:hypothetical protein